MTPRARLICLISLIACSAVVYLAGNGSVSLWDRDEPRFAQTSRQMLQSGDWVVPHYMDKPRTAKPALIYWCQAGAMKIFANATFAARLPSSVAMVLLLIVMSIVFWQSLGAEITLWTVFIFATSGLAIAAAKMCITDAVLTLFITIAQLCFYLIWQGNRSWLVVLTMWLAVAAAMLTKGPVILGMMGMTALALTLFEGDSLYPVRLRWNDMGRIIIARFNALKTLQWLGRIRPRVGLMVVLAVVLPWVLMVSLRTTGFLLAAFKHEVWDRMLTPLEQHKGPFGYYFLTIWITFFPWSLLLPLAMVTAYRHRADPKIRFALAAIIGPWFMLECFKTKLPHYFLPSFPALAFLTANALVRSLRGEIADLKSKQFVIAVGSWACVVALAASGTWLVIRAPIAMPTHAMVFLSVFGVIFGATVFIAFKLRRIVTGAICMGMGTFAFVVVMYLWYLPNAAFLRMSPRLADILIRAHATGDKQAMMIEYMEPSLAFAQGGTIREATGDVGFLKKYEPNFTPWIVVTRAVWDRSSPELKNDFDIVGEVFGLAYADKGKWETVMVLHRKPAASS